MMTSPTDKPISEVYLEQGNLWKDAEAEASIREDTKSSYLAELALRVVEETGVAYNRAEAIAKASEDNRKWIREAIEARRYANELRVRLDSLKMAHAEWQSDAANERLQAKL